MRWPWEWGRRSGGAAGDGGATGSAATSRPSPSEPAPTYAPGSGRSDWAHLPPVQRSLDDHGPSVAPPDAFRAGLTTHQNPSLLAPLGHLVDADGPSGVVGGLAAAAPGEPVSYAGAIELRVPEPAPKQPARAAVQRRIASVASESVVHDHPDHQHEPDPPAPVLSELAAGETAATWAPAEPGPAVSGDGPERQPLVVARDVDGSRTAGSMSSQPVALQRLADEPSQAADPQRDPAPPVTSAVSPASMEQTVPTVGEAAPTGFDRPAAEPATTSPSLPVASATVPVQRAASNGAMTESTTPHPGPRASSAHGAPATPPLTVSRLATRPDSPVSATPLGQSPAPASAGADLVPTSPPTASGHTDQPQPAASSSGSTGSAAAEPVESSSADPSAVVPTIGAGPSAELSNAELPSVDLPGSGPASAGLPSAELPSAGLPSAELTIAGPPSAELSVARSAIAPSAVPEPTVARLLAGRPVLSEPVVGSDSATVEGTTAPLGGPASTGTSLPVPGRASPTTIGTLDTGAARNATPGVQRQDARPTSGPVAQSLVSASPGAGPVDTPTTEPAGTGPTGGLFAGTTETVQPSLSAPDPSPEAEYPPMIQRRLASPAVESPEDQAPLSGFAAAITALQQEPDDGGFVAGDPPVAPNGDSAAGARANNGPDLVVARQAVEPPATGSSEALANVVPLVTATGRGRGTTRPASATPELVVARRIGPDSSGSLPAADVRLPVPTSRPLVQRRLLADQPVPIAPPPDAAPAAAPQVQRIRYEDSRPAGRTSTEAVPWEAAVRPAGRTSTAVLPQRAQSADFPPPSDTSSAPASFDAAMPSASTPLPAAVQRVSDTASRLGDAPAPFGSPTALTPPAEPVRPLPIEAARHEPFVQRSTDPRPSSSPTVTTFGPTSPSSTSFTSSRTVGLAEMFALAASDTDGPAVQRSTSGAPAATEVQLAPADAPAPSGPAPAASGAAAAPGGAPGANDIEEMARRLYEPLSARLRAEFWQDRERAGLLTDFRP